MSQRREDGEFVFYSSVIPVTASLHCAAPTHFQARLLESRLLYPTTLQLPDGLGEIRDFSQILFEAMGTSKDQCT